MILESIKILLLVVLGSALYNNSFSISVLFFILALIIAVFPPLPSPFGEA